VIPHALTVWPACFQIPFARNLFFLVCEDLDHVIPRIFSRNNICADGKDRRGGSPQRTFKELIQSAFDESGNMSTLISFHREMLAGYWAPGLEAKACHFSLEGQFQTSVTDGKHLFKMSER